MTSPLSIDAIAASFRNPFTSRKEETKSLVRVKGIPFTFRVFIAELYAFSGACWISAVG